MKAVRTAFDDWHDACAKGESVGAPDVVFKQFVPDEIKAIDEAKRQVRFRITTSTPDRMNDTIAADGWDLKHFKRNPVVMWAHRYDEPPIGRSVKMETDEKGLISTAEFASKEQYPFAETIYQLILGGFLKATSVGFKPIKHVYNEARGGVDFIQQSLLEFSVVPIPANAEALMEASAAGIDIDPLREWAQSILDSAYDEPGVWVPRRQVELMLRALPAGGKTISLPAIREVRQVGDVVLMSDGTPKTETCAQDDCPNKPKPKAGTCDHADCPMKPKPGKAAVKGKVGCPRGESCPANEGIAGCPERDQCPMPGGATQALDDAAIAQRVRDLVAAGKSEAAFSELLGQQFVPRDKPPAPVAKITLELDDGDEQIIDLEVDPDDVGDVDPDELRMALQDTLPALIRQEFNRLRGRVD